MQPERRYLIHPTSIIMVLLMAGLLAVFLALGFAYVYVRIEKGVGSVPAPGLFFANTLVLLAAGISIHRWKEAYRLRRMPGALHWGWITLLLSILFLAGQGTAWWGMLAQGRMPGSSPGFGYLYALSILHLLHVLAGMPFLLRVLVPFVRASAQDTAATLYHDVVLARRLRHTAWYWHFLDAVWLGIMVLLVVNSLL